MPTQLDELIEYWKNKLFYDRHLMPPSVQFLTEQTIKHLQELKKLKEN